MPTPPDTLFFTCPACGLGLNMDGKLAGTSGPCPSCKTVITAPAIKRDFTATFQPDTSAPQQPLFGDLSPRKSHDPKAAAPGSRDRGTRPKARISADSNIDHSHLEHKETMQTLKVLFMFLLVALIVMGVIGYLKSSM